MAIRAESLADVMREKTDYWERRADRYEVPMPSWPVTASQINENWEKDEKGRWNLTTAGIYQVSTLIYEAQKRRRERWLALATLLAALTGILGTLIGVIAAWKR